MKSIQRLFIFILISALATISEQANSQKIQFDNFKTSRGLSSNFVNAVSSDEFGFLWLGTDKGIIKFDGNRFYKILGADEIVNDKIFSIKVITHNNIWMGMKNGKVARYNGQFVEYIIDKSNCSNANLFLDSKDRIWIATEGDGAYLISNPHEYLKEEINIEHFHKLQGMPYDVYEVGEDLKGKLYFLTKPGIKVFDEDENKLLFFRPNNLPRFIYNCMVADSNGIYLGANQGIVYLDFIQKGNPVKSVFEGPDFENISCVVRDHWGAIWFGTKDAGILKLENGKFKMFTKRDGLPGNKIKSLFADKEGNIWIGHFESGLTAYKGSVFTHFNDFYKDGPVSVYSLYYCNEFNKLLVGTDKGLFEFEHTSKGFAFNSSPVLQRSVIESIIDWDDHSLAIGTYGDGVYILNKKSLAIIKVINNEREKGYINQIHKIDPMNMLVAHQYGLYSMNVESLNKYVYQDMEGIEATSILSNGTKQYWIGTSDKGLYRLDNNICIEFQDDRLKNKSILSLQHQTNSDDSNSTVLVGTANSGMFKMVNGKILNNNNINLTTDQSIYSINQYGENIWLGTERGIVRYNVTSNETTIFDRNQGFTNDEMKMGTLCLINDSLIGYGTAEGLYFLNPYERKGTKLYPTLNITGVYANDSIPVYNNESIDYSKNKIHFNIAPVSLSFPYSVDAKYRLTGYDNSWLPLNDDKTIRFSKLPSGKYTLIVRASIDNKNFTEKSFKFTILAPFWKTIPFYIITILFLFGLISIGFRYNLKRELGRQELKHSVARKMAELEMKSLRSQMNPHFIFNSLQSIQNFLFENNNSLANEYLLKFSKLMRLILENSQYEVVTLKSDLMALEFYIQLENLRMPISYNYSFNIGEEVDIEEVSVPPLILQPFVENAIWHGLHHKKSQGNILISCSIDKNLLIFTIEDDGVGRSYIQDRERVPGFKKKSLGVKITEERIKILSENSPTPAKIDFEDLYDKDHNPAGTRVKIAIPFEV